MEDLVLLVAEDYDDGEDCTTSGWVVVVWSSGGTEHPSQTSSSLIWSKLALTPTAATLPTASATATTYEAADKKKNFGHFMIFIQ